MTEKNDQTSRVSDIYSGIIGRFQKRQEDIFDKVVSAFDLGNIKDYRKLESGLVNISYFIKSERGNFVIQKLAGIWDHRVIDDYVAVQRYLRTNGINVPILLNTKEHKPWFSLNGNGDIWRAFEYIPNDEISEPNINSTFEAGKLLGKFHHLMDGSGFKPSFSLPGFHDTPKILSKLEKFLKDDEQSAKAGKVIDHAHFLLSETPKFYLNGSRKQLIHGDPKLANFLFSEGRAIALLDLDTMMNAPIELDIGDAFRSWCRRKPSSSEFRPEIFSTALNGYNEGYPLAKITAENAKKSMALLTLELATRYLNDYFEENYFAHSTKYASRAEQGLARSLRYTDYYRNFI